MRNVVQGVLILVAGLVVFGVPGCKSVVEQVGRIASDPTAADLPTVYNPFDEVSSEEEIQFGRELAATVAGRYGVVQDSALTMYVNLVGSTLAAADPTPGIVYRFAVLDDDRVNAMSVPGGYVFVSRGALDRMTDEAMLAGVLAHEIEHVRQRHIIEHLRARDRKELFKNLAVRMTDLDFDTEDGLGKLSRIAADKLFEGLTREDELEADRGAARLAAAAGYDPTGLQRFLDLLERDLVEVPWPVTSDDHPFPDDRKVEIQAAIDALDPAPRTTVTAAERFHEHCRPSSGR